MDSLLCFHLDVLIRMSSSLFALILMCSYPLLCSVAHHARMRSLSVAFVVSAHSSTLLLSSLFLSFSWRLLSITKGTNYLVPTTLSLSLEPHYTTILKALPFVLLFPSYSLSHLHSYSNTTSTQSGQISLR